MAGGSSKKPTPGGRQKLLPHGSPGATASSILKTPWRGATAGPNSRPMVSSTPIARTPRRALALSLSLAFAAAPSAQTPAPTDPGAVVPNSYVVVFAERSFTLDTFRDAIYARRPAAEVDAIVASMNTAVRTDQAAFVAQVESLGGRVVSQWWLINGACVEGLPAEQLPTLRALPNVEAVHPNKIYSVSNNTARNSSNHEADQANARRNAANELVVGTGISVAVLDTGADVLYAATGKPHPALYITGNQNNTAGGGIQGSRLKGAYSAGFGTEDGHGHGTHVSGSVASDYVGYRGMAPGAWIVAVKVADDQGFGNTNTLVSGWQQAATRRTADNVGVANNSMSGSPALGDPAQMALDSAAINADILCVVASGNNGTNTSASQNAWNGLAVGAVNKTSLTVAGFSSRGTLSGFGRTYPDLSAVGVSVLSAVPNALGGGLSDGTSMASPMVAGGAACVRQANRSMTAREAKALLLNNVKGTTNQRTTYGLGILDIDAAVARAIANDFGTVRLTSTAPVWNRQFNATLLQFVSVTATWMHAAGTTFENVDLRLYDSNNTLLASDLNTLQSYEKASFTALVAGTIRAELRWVNPVAGRSVDVAITGVGSLAPTAPPVLTAINPGTVNNPAPAEITLTGTNFDGLTRITVGGVDVPTFSVDSATQARFTLAGPYLIGTHNVTASNVVGTSNPLTVTVNGIHPMQLTGPAFGVRGFPANYAAVGDAGWISVLFFSTSNLPSSVPGLVSLNIGNNFTDLYQLVVVANDGRGAFGIPLTIPTSVPSGLNLSFQAVTVNPASLTPPIEASNAVTTAFF
jgi:hypothetical protein